MFFLQALWVAFLVICVGAAFTLLSAVLTIMGGYNKDIDEGKEEDE